MKQKKTLLWMVLAFIILIGGASVLYGKLGKAQAREQLAVISEEQFLAEQPAKTDSAEQEEPAEVPSEQESIAEFSEKQEEAAEPSASEESSEAERMKAPDFHEKYLESGEEIQFLMINMTDGSRETKETAVGFIEKKQYEFPVFFDTEFDAAMAFGAYSLPTTFFLDKDGYVIAHAAGAIDGKTLQKGIDLIAP